MGKLGWGIFLGLVRTAAAFEGVMPLGRYKLNNRLGPYPIGNGLSKRKQLYYPTVMMGEVSSIRKISETYERPSFLTGFPCLIWALMDAWLLEVHF